MKEFIISEVKTETAILVGLITKEQDEAKTKEYLDELEFLADTAGAVTVKRFTQRVNGPSAVTYVGKGKLEEIKEYIKQKEDDDEPIGMVIFDDELSAKQMRNIEQELGVKILDRTSLCVRKRLMRRHRLNWHNIVICYLAYNVYGHTWSVRVAVLALAVVRDQ